MKQNEMKTNELRIGNLIDYFGDIIKVDVIDCFDGKERVCGETKDGRPVCDKPTYFEPIELTEEVLLKIGFEDRKGYFNYSQVFGDENNYCDSIHIYYCPMLKHFRFTHDKVKEFDLQTMDLYNIQYLHELQNAYYCLTGQELNIEL